MLSEEQKQMIEKEKKAISDNINNIEHRILIFSGKGGVGKTTVSVNLAYGLQKKGYKTGLLDADVTGPNVPKMLGLSGDLRTKGHRIQPLIKDGVEVMSIANALPSNQPVIWRGPMRSKLLRQFLADVEWGHLTFLLADLPPGTGDEVITIVQKMKPEMAVVVTTPQEVSLLDSARAINMAKKMGISKIGVIENMSGFICPECGSEIDLFGSGGGKKQAEKMDITFLGKIPLDIEAREDADRGKLIIQENHDSSASIAIMQIVKKIEKMFIDDSTKITQKRKHTKLKATSSKR